MMGILIILYALSNSFWREYVGIEPTREAPNPLQTVLKTARHTSTYLPPGRSGSFFQDTHTQKILSEKEKSIKLVDTL